ncbi:MAG TPA: M56 family metallopeptidase [Candidatus Dormibacteraeota bacterium]|nr:M56 family metallopeptidase [Candidatus Dormibacteraeota bacterium]
MGSIHLGGFGLVASCCIRILAGYVLFMALTRFCSRSYVRHALWLVFLTGAGVYWATLVAQELKPDPLTHAAIHSVSVDDLAPSSSTTTIAIPYSWDRRFELTGIILVCAYAGGLILMLSRLIRRRRLLCKAVARAEPVSPGFESEFEKACCHLGVSRCRILELPGLSSPGTAYTWKPLVLLPDGLDLYLDSEQFVDVLYHELIHIRRLDFLWNTVGELVSCLLFFHPAIWLALSKLSRERELACDEAVMRLRQGRRPDYALCLTRLARRRILGRQLEAPSHLALLDSFLALRVQTLLKESRPRTWWKRSAAISASVLALSLFLAGWSTLSLAVELARPMGKSSPLTVQGASLAASQTTPVGAGKPHVFSSRVKQLPPNAPKLHEVPTAPDQTPLATSDGNIEAVIASPQVGSRVSPKEVDEQSTWDEAPPAVPSNSPISLRRAAMGAAIGALEHVALGGKDVDKDIDKGGGRNPAGR